MDRRTPVARPTERRSIAAKYKHKDWVRKLEAASGKPVQLPQKTGCVYLLIDCSSSMGSKMEQAQSGSIAFSDEARRKGYLIGLIAFASSAEHVLEPQPDLTVLSNSIMRLIPSGSTNLTDAIRIAKDELIDKASERVICVVTDGMPNNEHTALEAARAAHNSGIDIMTIGTDDADRDFLRRLSTSNELAMRVSNNELESAIASMAKMLPERSGLEGC